MNILVIIYINPSFHSPDIITTPRITPKSIYKVWRSLSGKFFRSWLLYIYCGGCVFTLVDKASIMTFWFKVKFDLWGQDQSTPKIIQILTKVFCTSGPNLVILVQRVVSYQADKLLIDWHTQRQTPRHTDRRRQWQYLMAKTGLG